MNESEELKHQDVSDPAEYQQQDDQQNQAELYNQDQQYDQEAVDEQNALQLQEQQQQEQNQFEYVPDAADNTTNQRSRLEEAANQPPPADGQEAPSNVYITALDDQGVDRNLPQGKSADKANYLVEDENNIFKQYSQEEIENFRCIFDMFDKEKTGFVEIDNLVTIMKSLGRQPDEALELVQGLQLDSDGRLSFEEFLKIMKNLENRLVQGKTNEEEGGEEIEPVEGTLEDRNKFGALLPRTGVHFLPDSKVVDFLKLLNDYRKKCCAEMNLPEAKRAQLKFEDLKNKEMLRQLQNMRQAQEQELITVESAQRSQFLEFSGAWDNYMSDYEATAYLSLEKLKEKHQLEIQQLHEKIRAEHSQKVTHSRKLMILKDKVRKLTFSKRYDEAEMVQLQAQELEAEEMERANDHIEEQIEKQEALLRQKQQQALSALLKRIQRDRNEQLKHRQIDSQRLIQRNKNLLLDLLNKQNMETRRTNQFLKVALGARSPGRAKYFKSKFHDMSMQETRLNFNNVNHKPKTSYGGNRGNLGKLSRENRNAELGLDGVSPDRAQTTNAGNRMQSYGSATTAGGPQRGRVARA